MEKQRKIVEQKCREFVVRWKDRRDYLADPAVLKRALDEYEIWQRYYGADGAEGSYFWLRSEQDKNSHKIKAKLNKTLDFGNRMANEMQFFILNISKIPSGLQAGFLKYEGLEDYRHFLEKLFAESKYLLSDPEEKIINLKTATSYLNWVKMTEGFLAREERPVDFARGRRRVKNFSEILSLTDSPDKRIRDSAAAALNDILEKNSDVAEAEINSVLADKKINDELRHAFRPDLLRHVSDDIGSETADILVGAVSAKFSVAKRYYKLKAGLLGVERMKYHERNVAYGNMGAKCDYRRAVELVYGTLRGIDEDFASIFRSFVANGQIDVFPRKGKADGGFCFHNLISQPTYILLNYTNKLKDAFVLAHEVGHGINNELMKRKQNALNFGTPLFTAEVASKLMETFLFEKVLSETEDESRLAIMMLRLNDDISYIFRAAAQNKFERELHLRFREKGYLSKKEIGRIFRRHMSSYMGSAVEQSPGSENWWIYINHFRTGFYNYQYAGGLLIAKAFYELFKKDQGFTVKIKEFLAAGMSDFPENILKSIGLDINNKGFWFRGIGEVEELLRETEKLAEKLGKI